jgi:hypothetical protein
MGKLFMGYGKSMRSHENIHHWQWVGFRAERCFHYMILYASTWLHYLIHTLSFVALMFQSEVLEAAFPIMPNTRTQLQKLGAEICHISMILPGKLRDFLL